MEWERQLPPRPKPHQSHAPKWCDPTREPSGFVFQVERMNGLPGTLMSVCHWSHVSLHSGEGRWSSRLPGAWDLTLRSIRDFGHKAEHAPCRTDDQGLSKNDVGFWHCAERRAQVKEGSIHIGMADVSHECSEPTGIQTGTTEHDQKMKEPRPLGRRASCPLFLPQKDGPLVGHTIPLLNTDTNSALYS